MNHKELIARLRVSSALERDRFVGYGLAPLVDEAADMIEAAIAERDEVINTTANTSPQKALTLADLEAVEKLIAGIPKHTDWVLAAPDGRVWKGPSADLLTVLISHHPTMKLPMFKG